MQAPPQPSSDFRSRNKRAPRASAHCAAGQRVCHGSWSAFTELGSTESVLAPIAGFRHRRVNEPLTQSGGSIKFDGFAAWAARGAPTIEDARSIFGDSQTG